MLTVHYIFTAVFSYSSYSTLLCVITFYIVKMSLKLAQQILRNYAFITRAIDFSFISVNLESHIDQHKILAEFRGGGG